MPCRGRDRKFRGGARRAAIGGGEDTAAAISRGLARRQDFAFVERAGFERTDPFRHLQQMLADFIARNLSKVSDEIDLVAAEAVAFGSGSATRQFFEKERDRSIEQPRRL